MTMPLSLFSIVIVAALILVGLAPLILLGLWVRDRLQGTLW